MLEKLTERVSDLVQRVDPFGFDVKIDLSQDGVIHIASTEAPVIVTNDDQPAAATLKLSAADLDGILEGTQSASTLFLFGRIRVNGDVGKVMALAKALSG